MGFLWAKWAISSPIVLTFGLPIILDRNDWKNKFELDISKIGSNMAMPQPKIASMDVCRKPLSSHISAIFSRIWTNLVTKMISSSRRIYWCKETEIGPFYKKKLYFGATLGMRVPNQVQKLGFGLTYHPQPVTPNLMFPKNSLPYPP